MVASILAFRPAIVVRRLAPRSEACPLALRDVLAAGGPEPLPLVRAPTPGVARAALVAAKQAHSALGLALPPAAPPEAWFAAVAREVDELAPRLPVFFSAEVVVGGSDEDLERSTREAWRLVEAGVTHLAVDVQAVPSERRAEAVRRLAQPALEQELGLDLVLPQEAGRPSAGAAATLLEELLEAGISPDVASGRWPLPRDEAEARTQARQLVDLCGWIDPVPLLRRGVVSSLLLAQLAGTPVRICEDGGAAQSAARRALGLAPEGEETPRLAARERLRRVPDGAQGVDGFAVSHAPARDAREMPPEIGDRPEALAYVETLAFLEALGAVGSAGRLLRALERRFAEG